MAHSFGRADTINGQKYVQKLCKHWAHKFDVDFENGVGRVSFNPEEVVILESTDEALLATLVCSVERVGNLQDLVVEHVQRFSPTETLSFAWSTNEPQNPPNSSSRPRDGRSA